MTPSHDNGVGPLFVALLRRVSAMTLLPMLTARRRFFLAIEILLGHAPTRGGRTRDFPFSPDRVDSAQLARQLAQQTLSFRPGRSDEHGEYSLYDLVVALSLLETSTNRSDQDALALEQHFTIALRVLIDLMLDASHAAAAQGLFGISDNGAESALSRCTQYRRCELAAARRLAVLANVPVADDVADRVGHLARRFDLRPRELAELTERRVTLIHLKTKGTQAFIDECLSPYLQRGASFWCAQTCAAVRDLLLEDDGTSLILDNDAMTVLCRSAGDPLDALEKQVRSLLHEDDGAQVSRRYLADRYPRLLPYYDAARSTAVATSNCLPPIGLLTRNESLLDLATDGRASRGPDRDAVRECIVRGDACGHDAPPAGQECSGRRRDARLALPRFAVPDWYSPGRGEGYGFAAIAFSLAELAYAKTSNAAIAAQLNRQHGLALEAVATQRQLLRRAGLEGGRLAYLKFDGDRVGALFTGLPTLARPRASMALDSLLRHAWIDAVAGVARAQGSDALPADLLYLGGDDLLMTLPAALLDAFVQAFDAAIATQTAAPAIHFTFAAVTIAPLPVDHRDRQPAALLHARAVGQVNTLLRRAKQEAPEGNVPDEAVRRLVFPRVHGLVRDLVG